VRPEHHAAIASLTVGPVPQRGLNFFVYRQGCRFRVFLGVYGGAPWFWRVTAIEAIETDTEHEYRLIRHEDQPRRIQSLAERICRIVLFGRGKPESTLLFRRDALVMDRELSEEEAVFADRIAETRKKPDLWPEMKEIVRKAEG